MALVECKKCGKEVSTKAEKCPHCGVKKPAAYFKIRKNITLLTGFFKTKQGMSVVGLVFIIGFINAIALFIFSLFILATALINIVDPIKLCAITERRTAAMLSLISFILVISAVLMVDAVEKEAKIEAKIAAAKEQQIKDEARIAELNKRKAEEARCRRDVKCFGEKYKTYVSDSVINECMNNLEELAEHDFKWDNGKFNVTWYEVTDLEKGIIKYYGNNLKFQNGFGGWDDVTYTCAVDIPNEKFVDVEIKIGR